MLPAAFSISSNDIAPSVVEKTHCSAFGETPEAALAEVLLAKAAWLEAAHAEGKPVPPPTFRPVIYQADKEVA